jgi:hypothetical protein
MVRLENISTGEFLVGEELEFFVDDSTLIGEVYLDGDLIYQSMDTVDEDQLEIEFSKEYIIEENFEEENEDADPYGFDEWN